MADISRILTEAWIKVNEGIGNAANSIADATKGKVNEINLNTRRNEILNMLAPKIVELYKSGVELPDEIASILKELTEVEEKIEALKPAQPAQAPVMDIPEEEGADVQEDPEVQPKTTDEDVPVIHVDAEEVPVPVAEAPESETKEEVDYAVDGSADCKGNEAAQTVPDPETSSADPGQDAPASEKTAESDLEKAADEAADSVDDVLEQCADQMENAARNAAETTDKVFDKAVEAAGKVAEGIGKAADKALDYAQKALDDPDKAANAAAEQVGKVVDGLGKVAEKAANAFSNFIDNLSRKDDDK